MLSLAALVSAGSASAGSLEDALVSTFPGALSADGEGLAQAFARSVAASFPVTGTSASYAYRFDPATDSFRRLSISLGPVFSERAVTIGQHKLDVGVSYVYADYGEIYGRSLRALTSNNPAQSADFVQACLQRMSPSGQSVRVCEPVQAAVRLDV